jgi:hypothetical protein
MRIRRTPALALALAVATLVPALAEAGGARFGHGGGPPLGHGRGGHSGWMRPPGGLGHRPVPPGRFGWKPYHGFYPGYAYRPFAPFRAYAYWPGAYYLSVPTAVYLPPVTYSYVQAPPVVYAEPMPPAAAEESEPREVVYPNGKYVLRGDGVSTPYHWAWIPNPPPSPPDPGAAVGPEGPARR